MTPGRKIAEWCLPFEVAVQAKLAGRIDRAIAEGASKYRVNLKAFQESVRQAVCKNGLNGVKAAKQILDEQGIEYEP